MFKRLVFGFLSIGAVPAMAAEWFVSPSGNDSSGTGSIASPFRTVRRVVDTSIGVVNAGDTITLRAGTYNECDVRLRKPLTLRSYSGERAHVHCDITVPDSVVVQIDRAASGSRVAGLELSGGMYYGVMLQTDWWGTGQGGTGPSNVVLEDLYIHDTGRDGIKLTPKTNHVTIRRNEIARTGAAEPPGTALDYRNADGIDMVNVQNVTVEDNYIHDISTTGLYFKGGSSDVVVQRNRIENTGMGGILAGFDTSVEFFDLDVNPHYYEAVRGQVVNNVVRNTDYEGIGLYSAQSTLVANNTIVDTGKVGHSAIYYGVPAQDWDPNAERPATTGAVVRNNLVIQDGGTCVEIRWFRDLEASGLSGSPDVDYNAYYDRSGSCRFVDNRPGTPDGIRNDNGTRGGNLALWRSVEQADAHSFETVLSVDENGHLPPGSPAIKAGQALPQFSDDIERRPRSAPYDIGAHEASPPREEVFQNGFD